MASLLKPQYYIEGSGYGKIGLETEIESELPIIRNDIEKLRLKDETVETFRHVRFHKSIDRKNKEEISGILGLHEFDLLNAYIISIEEGIDIYSESEQGFFHAWQTLKRLTDKCRIPRFTGYDKTLNHIRAVKMYLPGIKKIKEFKEFIDLLASYNFNTVMLEVGGAMEYRKHPEINEGWIEYCKFMNEYPGKGRKLQEQYDWPKNSIHSENGGGNVLSQETVKSLVEYCRERMFNVIPEVPTLSHCDYLLLKHPELAERRDDPFPDTYCPSNPHVYELVFDVLEEVINVFAPETVNIGHDEYYSMLLCGKCRDKKAPELYAEDILKLRNYLGKKGIKTMIWGEKLLDAHTKNGTPIGGAKSDKVPAVYPAIHKIPEDLLIANWYWVLRSSDETYHRNGLNFVYGNFEPLRFMDCRERMKSPAASGIIISNWGTTDFITLQRNGILFDIIYTAFLFGRPAPDQKDEIENLEDVFQELQNLRTDKFSAGRNTRFRFVHTADTARDYTLFVDGHFVNREAYIIGEYDIKYNDGSSCVIPVIQGENISWQGISWDRTESAEYDSYDFDRRLPEVSYTTRPFRKNGITWFEFFAKNPFPEKTVTCISIKSRPGAGSIILKSFEIL